MSNCKRNGKIRFENLHRRYEISEVVATDGAASFIFAFSRCTVNPLQCNAMQCRSLQAIGGNLQSISISRCSQYDLVQARPATSRSAQLHHAPGSPGPRGSLA